MSNILRKFKRQGIVHTGSYGSSLRAQGLKEIKVIEKGKPTIKTVPIQEPFRLLNRKVIK